MNNWCKVNVEVSAEMPDIDVAAECASGRLVDITDQMARVGMERSVFVSKASLQWVAEVAGITEDQAEVGVTAMVGISLGDIADHVSCRNGVIDQNQFFRETHWKGSGWHEWAVTVLAWDPAKEETVAVWGFLDHMKALSLVHLQPGAGVS